MYDTVAALWREAPASLLDAIPWREDRSVQTEQGVRRTLRGGVHGGVQVILHPDGVLKAERSLPKALTGQNAEDITQADVPLALEAMDRELYELTGRPMRPFGEWDPCRVDYPVTFHLEDPALVGLALGRLATVRLPRKGRPVVGESGSVSWPRGEFRPKFYNKGRETGEARYMADLRHEVGVFGSRALGSIPALLPTARGQPSSAGAPRLRVVDVLVPQAHRYVTERFARYFGGYIVNVDDLSDVEFLRSMVNYFGARRAFGLLGLCLGWGLLGVRGPADLEAAGFGEQTTWYRAMADLRRWRDALAEVGEAPESVDQLRERVALVARRAA